MRQVNIHAAKTHLSRLIEDAAAGEEIIIAKHGKPVARLVSMEQKPAQGRRPGILKGKIKIHDNFDDPLPPDIAKAFGADQ
ncbi:MAG: type II toxin-antitoxin system Phd/YefM family antitoxin [Proteobacteria bacterium]|nr:type II toxin-antitoxin system Phd/YefM family antitoxin [Pseudomonadota bacterium]